MQIKLYRTSHLSCTSNKEFMKILYNTVRSYTMLNLMALDEKNI